MGLYKKEVLIRPTSTVTVSGAYDWTRNWLQDFQDKSENKDSNGNYIDYYFADIFDSRTSNIYRIYSNPCEDKYDLTELRFTILDTSRFVDRSEISDNPDITQDTDKLATREAIGSIVSNEVANLYEIVNEVGTISNKKMALTREPAGEIISGTCEIHLGDDVYDRVSCIHQDGELVINEDSYEGKECIVSFLAK